MSTSTRALPPEFEDLEALVERWVRPTENARSSIRLSATATDFAAFHAKLAPRLEALLKYLAGCDARLLRDGPERSALLLACAFAEAAPHHELYAGSSEVPHSFDARRFVPDRGDELT
jgi:hypothetical protein